MKRTLLIIAAVLFLITGRILYAQGERRLIGGACSYEKTPGTCQITLVAKTDESIRQATTIGGPGYEGYAVKFKFNPSQRKLEYGKAGTEYKEHTLRLTNSWYPGKEFLEKYSIKEGKTFNCVMGQITKGSCTPVIFEFPGINTSDYFETKR